MRRNTLATIAVLSLVASPLANAALSISSGVGLPALGSCKINFDDLQLGSQAGTTASGPSASVTVTTTGNAAVVTGTNNPIYAAPVLSGNNGDGFGPGGIPQPNGPNTTNYLAAGTVAGGGSVTLTFSSPQTYIGLLWGSVDGTSDIFNTLEFFNGAVPVGSLTGLDVNGVIPNGSQAADGTAYVNITSDQPFTSVRATSTGTIGFTFELDNVAITCPVTGCTLTQGYWKNHEENWPVANLTLGTVAYNQAQLLAILKTPVKGNGLVSLAHQLIAAKLNIAAGASVPASVADAILAADLLIAGGVLPPHGTASVKPGPITDTLIGILDAYNNGLAAGGPKHCN